MKFKGLSDNEVIISREKYGSNSLTEQKQESFFHKLLGNFGDPMIKILCVALVLNVIFVCLHYFADIGDTEWYETAGIAAAVLIATIVSTLSEYKNENAFRRLQDEASKIKCKVYRNGIITEIPIDDIVCGDRIMLQTGDMIPADGTVIYGTIHTDQSTLNGESKEISKTAADPSNRKKEPDLLDSSSVFRGTVVCSGNAVMQAENVGDKTVYGTIAKELQSDDDRESPLKLKLTKLAGTISRFGYIGGAAVALVYIIKVIFLGTGGAAAYFASPELYFNLFRDIVRAVMFAVIIIVMAVPEGLPLMIAIVSSLNMKKMLKDNVLVRKVSGIETAGSLNILFSDKTGTITKGRLEAVLFTDGKGNEAKCHSEIKGKCRDMLTLALMHNTDAVISGTGNDIKIIGGNPTERAVLAFVSGADDPCPDLKTVCSMPFNSTDKFSAATVSDGKDITFIKGAPEKILKNCRYCYDENGEKVQFDRKILETKIDSLAERAIRILAVASADGSIKSGTLPEGEWTLIGVIGIRDEVRTESVTAIKEVNRAGIQVVMITGDRKETAVAIARDSGLLKNSDDLVFTSNELSEMSDDDIKAVIPQIRVIARALPSDKSRLVRLSQELGLVVGMTGDGVNDSPALKKADVGFAMGGGTEVAKEAGDIVILDDNFNSISKAILYGRTIFNNIRKFISFQLAINLSAVLISFIMPLLGLPNPLTITQILWVNLVMDTLAALALGGEPALARYMNEKPKRRDENIISPFMKSRLAVATVWVFAVSCFILLSQFWESSPVWYFVRSGEDVQNGINIFPHLMTVYFCYFIFTAVFNSLNVRTEKLNVFDHISQNKQYFLIMGLIVIIQILLTYFGGDVFGCSALNMHEWLFVICTSVSIIPIDLLRKALTKK